MKVKILLKFLLKTFSHYMRSLINFSNERAVYLFLQGLRKASLENNKSKLLTEFKIFPKIPKKLYPSITNNSDISIIIQGPIFDREFIQNTINWYRSCGIKNIIVSTNTPTDKFFKAHTISKNDEKPPGVWNENNQLETIRNALYEINDNDLVMKTRTDQRIYNEIFLSNLNTIHNQYHSEITKSGSRLGVISNNSSLLKINNISDHLYIDYGHQLKKMFDLEYRNRNDIFYSLQLGDKSSIEIDLLRQKLSSSLFTEFESEQWFFNSFKRNCLNYNHSDDFLLKSESYIESLYNYLTIIKNSIYVIDPEDIELFWIKSSIDTLPSFYHDGNQNKELILFSRLTKLNWLCLKNDDNYINHLINYVKNHQMNSSLF